MLPATLACSVVLWQVYRRWHYADLAQVLACMLLLLVSLAQPQSHGLVLYAAASPPQRGPEEAYERTRDLSTTAE